MDKGLEIGDDRLTSREVGFRSGGAVNNAMVTNLERLCGEGRGSETLHQELR